MGKNFCVNDKKVGSVWGDIATFEEIEEKMQQDESLGKIEFRQVLNDWNGKRYVFLRDEWNSENYLVELQEVQGGE